MKCFFGYQHIFKRSMKMAKQEATENLQQTDFSKWYLQAIQQGDLMDYGPARGTMIF